MRGFALLAAMVSVIVSGCTAPAAVPFHAYRTDSSARAAAVDWPEIHQGLPFDEWRAAQPTALRITISLSYANHQTAPMGAIVSDLVVALRGRNGLVPLDTLPSVDPEAGLHPPGTPVPGGAVASATLTIVAPLFQLRASPSFHAMSVRFAGRNLTFDSLSGTLPLFVRGNVTLYDPTANDPTDSKVVQRETFALPFDVFIPSTGIDAPAEVAHNGTTLDVFVLPHPGGNIHTLDDDNEYAWADATGRIVSTRRYDTLANATLPLTLLAWNGLDAGIFPVSETNS